MSEFITGIVVSIITALLLGMFYSFGISDTAKSCELLGKFYYNDKVYICELNEI